MGGKFEQWNKETDNALVLAALTTLVMLGGVSCLFFFGVSLIVLPFSKAVGVGITSGFIIPLLFTRKLVRDLKALKEEERVKTFGEANASETK